MSKIILMCGLPRSGKTTCVKKIKKDSDVIISADELRKIVYGQRFWLEGEPLMWSIRTMMLEYLMKQGKDIIIDETNTTIKRRKPIINIAKKYNYVIEIKIVSELTEKCIERANASNMNDLIPIITHMFDNFEFPKKEEGFDNIELYQKEIT